MMLFEAKGGVHGYAFFLWSEEYQADRPCSCVQEFPRRLNAGAFDATRDIEILGSMPSAVGLDLGFPTSRSSAIQTYDPNESLSLFLQVELPQ